MPGFRRRAARRRRGSTRRDPRDAAAGGARGEGARPQDAQVDRRLTAEVRAPRRLPGGRPARRRGRPRSAARPDGVARRRRPLHHAAGRDHPRPAKRPAQRRHVPDAGARPARDGDALAAAQGRPRRLPVRRRTARGRGRPRARPDHRVLGQRAVAEAHRRADGRGLPARRARRAGQGHQRRRRGARRRRDRARGLRRARRRGRRGAVRRPHRLLHTGRAFPGLPRDGAHDAARRDLPVDRRRQAAAGGRLARQGDRADLPAGGPHDDSRDRRLRPARSPVPSTTSASSRSARRFPATRAR